MDLCPGQSYDGTKRIYWRPSDFLSHFGWRPVLIIAGSLSLEYFLTALDKMEAYKVACPSLILTCKTGHPNGGGIGTNDSSLLFDYRLLVLTLLTTNP